MKHRIFEKATELMTQRNFEEAINILKELNEKEDEDIYDTCNNLGCAYMYNKEYSKALDLFNKALNLVPNDESYRSKLAENIDDIERIDTLLQNMRQDRGTIHANKSRVLDKLGRKEESDKEYNKAVEYGYTLQDIL